MAQKTNESQEYKAFVEAVSNGTLDRLYIFHGEEHYLMERYLEKIRKQLIPDGLEEFNHRRFEGRGLTAAAIGDAIDMFPVFSDRTLIEIHDYDIFKAPESERKQLISYFSDMPEYVCLIFIYDTIEFKPDKRLKDSKDILKNAHEVEFALQDGEKITRWVYKHVKEGGKAISLNDAEYLSFITGGQMTALNTEIEKLCSYANGDVITRQDIDTCVIPATDAVSYKLANAIISGNPSAATATLSDLLRMREPAHKILFTLSLTMRQLLWARICLDAGKNTRYLIEKFSFKFEFQAKNLISGAQKLSTDTCKKAVLLCSNAALAMNSGADPESSIAELVAALCFCRKAV